MVWKRYNNPSRVTVFAYASMAALCLIGVFLLRYLLSYGNQNFLLDPLFQVYGASWAAFFVSRLILERMYKPIESGNYQPTVTVIIPAKNEENAIGKTLEKVFSSNYPGQNLEVITVNDGSTDNTLEQMMKAKDRYPKLQIINFPANKGKRVAMATAIQQAHGEIIVSVDSDTFVENDTIRNLVAPFKDTQITGVSGHTDAQVGSNLLSRIQIPIYYMGFRLFKAAEQVLGSVTCLSGCLSAFRRSAVLPILGEWVDQSKRYFSGEDRALTTLLLREGGKLVFQDNARAKTLVPESFRVYARQQLRWKRSYFTENFRTLKFIWRRPTLFINITVLLFLSLLAPAVVFREMLITTIQTWSLLGPLFFVFGLCLLGMFYGWYQMILGGHGPRIVVDSIVSCLLYLLIVWEIPWALATLKDSRWLTRG